MDSNVDSLLGQNRLLTAEIQRRVNQLAAINVVAATVSQSLDLERTLHTALDAVLGIIVVDSAAISLVDEEADELVLRAQRGLDHDFVTQPMRVSLGTGMSGRAVIEDRLMVTEDLEHEEQLAVPAFLVEHVQAIALAPMHARGQVVGVLSVMSHRPYHFVEEELRVLRVIADQVGLALDNARLYEKTRHQQRRLSAIIHSTADAIIATDDRGRISLINSAARRLFHLSIEGVIGLPLSEAPLHPQIVDGLRVAMQSQAEEATLFDVRLNDGRTLSAVVSRVQSPPLPGAALYEHDDEGWVLVLQDVSEYKQAEDARVEFVRAAAHDMRNPLGVALSAITLLQDQLAEQDDPLMAETLNIAINSLHRIETLIDDMLQLERLQSGLNFKPQPVEVTVLVTRIFRDFAPVFQRRNQTGELMVMADPLTVALDVNWFVRAINNYLSNASKYTHEGGRIVLQVMRSAEELQIEVRDNGPGIPLESQARLFEKFYRAPSLMGGSGAPQGTGLGLAIVKSVAEAHGGRVYARSTPGQGSTFGLAVPLSGDAPTDPA